MRVSLLVPQYQVKIRNLDPNKDIGFIFDTWLNSYRYDSIFGKSIRNAVFFPNYRKIIHLILSSSESKIGVCCLIEDESIILGYQVINLKKDYITIHYMFTKEAFRLIGLQKNIFKYLTGHDSFEKINEVSHQTRTIKPLLKRFTNIIYNPFKLYKGIE